jgi:hypothetical protein
LCTHHDQISSVQEALRSVRRTPICNHLRHCAAQAISHGSPEEAEAMYDELLALIYKQSGKSDKRGLPWVAPEDLRVLFIGPHTHDHVEYLELHINGQSLRRFIPEYAPVPVMHDDVGEGETPLHVHKDHLPSQGLPLWAPGFYGPIVKKGDQLSTYSK